MIDIVTTVNLSAVECTMLMTGKSDASERVMQVEKGFDEIQDDSALFSKGYGPWQTEMYCQSALDQSGLDYY